MKPVCAASFVAALICHALLLFGFKMHTPASPLALSDEPSAVDVSLVASIPKSPPTETAPPPVAVPTPAPADTPAPSMPAPPPDMSTPPPDNVPAPAPASTAPPPKSLPRPREQRRSQQTTSQRTTLNTAASQGSPNHSTAPGRSIGIAARYRSNPKPDYPAEARRLQQEGIVMLNVEVNADGRASAVSLRSSSGFPLLDEAAIQAVRRWTFEPARSGPIPVASKVDVPVRFSLSN